jgi:hypothetical protein
MLSSSPSKIHEPSVTGVSPRPTDRRQPQKTAKHEGAGSTRSTRGADMIANGRTPPCSLTVGEGGRWVGMVDEPAQQHGHYEVFGPVLAADSALICLALCDNV